VQGNPPDQQGQQGQQGERRQQRERGQNIGQGQAGWSG
jgi:hypothetical protein